MFANLHAQNVLVAVKINADYYVHSLVDNMAFLLNLVVDCVQEHHSVSPLQRPGLPFPNERHDPLVTLDISVGDTSMPYSWLR